LSRGSGRWMGLVGRDERRCGSETRM
jgi:hypothetical protein